MMAYRGILQMHVKVSASRKANPAFIGDMVKWNICVILGRKISFLRI